MRIICKKSNLVKGVSIVSKAVPSKTTMPILECILIDATTDVIKLTAISLKTAVSIKYFTKNMLYRGDIFTNSSTATKMRF